MTLKDKIAARKEAFNLALGDALTKEALKHVKVDTEVVRTGRNGLAYVSKRNPLDISQDANKKDVLIRGFYQKAMDAYEGKFQVTTSDEAEIETMKADMKGNNNE